MKKSDVAHGKVFRSYGGTAGKTGRILVSVLLLTAMLFLYSCGAGEGETGGNGDAESGTDTLTYGSGDYTAINPALYEHGEINLCSLRD